MRFHLILFGVLLALSGCGKAEPPLPPVDIQPSQIEQKVYWSSDLNGRRIVIEGYVGFDNGPRGDAIAMGPELTTEPYGKGDPLLRVEIERGVGPNQINLPVLERKTMAGFPAAPAVLTVDLSKATLQDATGKARRLGQRIRVTGKLEYVRVENLGLISDPDPRSPTGRRLKPRLTDVVLEAPLH